MNVLNLHLNRTGLILINSCLSRIKKFVHDVRPLESLYGPDDSLATHQSSAKNWTNLNLFVNFSLLLKMTLTWLGKSQICKSSEMTKNQKNTKLIKKLFVLYFSICDPFWATGLCHFVIAANTTDYCKVQMILGSTVKNWLLFGIRFGLQRKDNVMKNSWTYVLHILFRKMSIFFEHKNSDMRVNLFKAKK